MLDHDSEQEKVPFGLRFLVVRVSYQTAGTRFQFLFEIVLAVGSRTLNRTCLLGLA